MSLIPDNILAKLVNGDISVFTNDDIECESKTEETWRGGKLTFEGKGITCSQITWGKKFDEKSKSWPYSLPIGATLDLVADIEDEDCEGDMKVTNEMEGEYGLLYHYSFARWMDISHLGNGHSYIQLVWKNLFKDEKGRWVRVALAEAEDGGYGTISEFDSINVCLFDSDGDQVGYYSRFNLPEELRSTLNAQYKSALEAAGLVPLTK